MNNQELYGYCGKILRVNLSTGDILTEVPPLDFYRLYIGGRGFIAPILLRELPKRVDPLGAKNKLIFALGPFTGHAFIGSGRNSIGAKSPLTGGLGESEVGGFWGARLRRAGFDLVVIEGAADRPVYIWIDNGNAVLREAENLWGLEVAETDAAIKEELGDTKISTAVIGPGGEKLIRFACIVNDVRHVAGRMGFGAVMGSKKLKAIAARGNEVPEVADRERLVKLSRWMGQNYAERSHVCEYGTGAAMEKYEMIGNLPIRNFQGGRFPGAAKIAPQRMFEKGYVERMDGCFGCPLRCKRRVKSAGPWPVMGVYGGPEYETLAAFGSNCGVDNLEALIKANETCNRYGIDTISAGVTISFAMECFERGVIGLKETGGLNLYFGNAEAMVELTEKICKRQGVGDILAEGTKRAARIIGGGTEAFAMQVKGLEIPMHEPRCRQGQALHYSVHFAGPDHNTGVYDDIVMNNLAAWERIDHGELIPMSELSPNKARMVYQMGLWRQLNNYLALCLFVPWSVNQKIEGMEALTGWPFGDWKLMKTAERGMTLARIFNIREGFSTADDKLPDRFYQVPDEGPLRKSAVDKEKMIEALRLYYGMLGWNENGVPTRSRLVELGIEWAEEFLYQ